MKKSFVLLALTAGVPAAFAQELRDDRLIERELAITESIRVEETANGPYSEPLIEHYTALSLLYEEAGDLGLADATIDRARQVIRANYGLDSLDQAPLIRRLMAHAEMLGDAQKVWDLEQELIGYANRHLGDLGAARIYRDVAERRMNILRRYDSGEFPPEIVLGCYYDDTGVYNELYRVGSRPITAMKDLDPVRAQETTFRRCRSGSQRTARRALLLDAQGYYARAVATLLSNDERSDAELEELLTTIVDISYQYETPSIGRQGLLRLVAQADENPEEVLPRVEAMVQLADWDLLSATNYGRIMAEAALETYREAYGLLREHGIDEAEIEAIFAPDIPVVLPAFTGNPLAPEDPPQSESFIDISFVVRSDGRADEIEVLQATEDVSRADERGLIRLIKRGRFRPRVIGGEFAEAAPVTLRYYPNS
ncbi:MAG: hypothetical protein PVH89_07240 [Gammaproteobacteria bacterium]